MVAALVARALVPRVPGHHGAGALRRPLPAHGLQRRPELEVLKSMVHLTVL